LSPAPRGPVNRRFTTARSTFSLAAGKVGRASAVKTEAEGLAIARGLDAQQEAVGRDQTALINVVRELSTGTQRFMPENLALNLGDAGIRGLTALIPMAMRRLSQGAEPAAAEAQPALKGPKPNGAAPDAAASAEAPALRPLRLVAALCGGGARIERLPSSTAKRGRGTAAAKQTWRRGRGLAEVHRRQRMDKPAVAL
jgi:hypothetical protein